VLRRFRSSKNSSNRINFRTGGARITGSTLIRLVLLCLLFTGRGEAENYYRYWVWFADKGTGLPKTGPERTTAPAYSEALRQLTPRAISRRQKVLSPETLVDDADLPLYQPYIHEVESLGGILIHQSRWTNSASFLLTPDQVAAAGKLPSIKSISRVALLRHRTPESETKSQIYYSKPVSLDYGRSYQQLQTIAIPQLHAFGITGRGVLIGMLDSGFRWRAHEALMSRHIIAEHDFIYNRNITSDQQNDTPGQDEHGTLTMSALGGFKPGQLIGPAFDADFALAKTELIYPSKQTDTDSLREEDNWVAGIEWLEALGVDVVSSSLGYDTFVDGPGYSWNNGDFNGRTTHAAQAAVRAARLGVVVCDAMGNEGNGDGIAGTMLTPADADSIISVGAVDFSGILAGFSSTGPTNDGRTKPDVVAPGVGVYCALPPGPATYSTISGTSLAAPLTAGSAALLLSVRPELTPIQLRNILRSTATPLTDIHLFPQSPNNFTGWGLINAFRAATSLGVLFGNIPAVAVVDSMSIVSTCVLSGSGIRSDSVILSYAIGDGGTFFSIPMRLDSPMVYATSGRYRATIPRQLAGTRLRFTITARDSGQQSYQSPPPGQNTGWQLLYGIPGIYEPSQVPESYILHQNFPNPFNSGTAIQYDIPLADRVRISVYNTIGQLVAVLADDVQDAGSHTVLFQASGLPSGVYFYRLSTSSFTSTKKMILLR
jgi:serine protease AprX